MGQASVNLQQDRQDLSKEEESEQMRKSDTFTLSSNRLAHYKETDDYYHDEEWQKTTLQ
jgi:hypothetical protein